MPFFLHTHTETGWKARACSRLWELTLLMRRALGISIELKGERPKAELKLVITTDNEMSEHEIGKTEPIQWAGKLYEYILLFLCSN